LGAGRFEHGKQASTGKIIDTREFLYKLISQKQLVGSFYFCVCYMDCGEMQKTQTDDRGPGRPTREQAAAIADAVLAGAHEMFLAKGYAAAGMDEIAAHVGVSKLTIYRRFPSKEALLIAVVDRVIAELTAAVELNVLASTSPLDALEETIKTVFKASVEPDAVSFGRLLSCESAHNAMLRQRFSAWQGKIRGPVLRQISAAQQQGKIDDGDPAILCAILCDLMDGLPKALRDQIVDPVAIDPEAFFQERWSFFLRAVSV
jgi:AcrR family transcriptional regulator